MNISAGIHIRATDEESTEMGREIGAQRVANHLRPRFNAHFTLPQFHNWIGAIQSVILN